MTRIIIYGNADFTGAAGLFTVVLDKNIQKILAAMLDNLKTLRHGLFMGGYESLILPVDPTNIRTANQMAIF